MPATKRAARAAARGFGTRAEERRHRMRRRTETATTADAQLDAAFDWFRSSARHAGPGDRGRLMRDMARVLAAAAHGIDQTEVTDGDDA